MDVYLFVIFLMGRSRRNDFGQGRRYKEGGMRKGGTLLPFYLFTSLPFYLFTLFTFLPFYLFTLFTLLPFLEFPSC